jgi:hypothetical protein
MVAATDSLQVRREKISERMKLLQDLVPGCSKVNISTRIGQNLVEIHTYFKQRMIFKNSS